MTTRNRIGTSEVKNQIDLMAKEQGDFAPPVQMTLPEMEKRAVVDALVRSSWNQTRAARLLGIPRHVLLYRMKKFDISRPE
jgi:two-component system NtrC family response regulator